MTSVGTLVNLRGRENAMGNGAVSDQSYTLWNWRARVSLRSCMNTRVRACLCE